MTEWVELDSGEIVDIKQVRFPKGVPNTAKTRRRIYAIAVDYCSRLGVPVPNIRVRTGDEMVHAGWCAKKFYGSCNPQSFKFGDVTITVGKTSTWPSVRDTILHEVVHWAFPKVKHGEQMNRYMKALRKGEFVFNGRGLVI
jgi:hypothetical protein